jgi:hypothetical protein
MFDILNKDKTFDVRLADWECSPGDTLVFDEIDDVTKEPTGRSIRRKVGFILKTKDMNFFKKEDVEKYGLQVISLLKENKS